MPHHVAVIFPINMFLLTGRLEIVYAGDNDWCSCGGKRVEVRNWGDVRSQCRLVAVGRIGRPCEESVGQS